MTNDPGNGLATMLKLVGEMPEHLVASAGLPGLDGIVVESVPGEVLVCGLGGSAIAADLAEPLVAAAGKRLTLWRDYGLPAWIGAGDTVVVSSYSGETEETLDAAREAARRGCRLIAVTSGGTLADWAAAGIEGCRPFPRVTLPGGLPPRAALGHGLGALLRIFGRLGVIADPGSAIDAAAAVLRDGVSRYGPSAPETENTALSLARHLPGRMIVIHTTSPETHAAGRRLKAQINENAKAPACVAEYPELDHNEIVGWELPSQRRGDFALLVLRSDDESDRISLRIEVTCSLLNEQFALVADISAHGDQPLARILYLVQFGDYMSCYLAAVAGVDPVPVDRIVALKSRLKGDSGQ